jgi:hypothetical protein
MRASCAIGEIPRVSGALEKWARLAKRVIDQRTGGASQVAAIGWNARF